MELSFLSNLFSLDITAEEIHVFSQDKNCATSNNYNLHVKIAF